MEAERKTSPIFKKLESYLSFKRCDSQKKATQVDPTGCFTVQVGPERERFVIKTKYLNHPMFKMLLEDAESEYGFRNDGPLTLPCEVSLFQNVLNAMDEDDWLDDACSPFHQKDRTVKNGDLYERFVPHEK